MKMQNPDEKREVLDADNLAALERGIKMAENGLRWTMDEAFEFAREHRRTWMPKTSDQRSAAALSDLANIDSSTAAMWGERQANGKRSDT